MLNIPVDIGHPRILLRNDDSTPFQEVVETLTHVFGKTAGSAKKLAQEASESGQADCGSYPPNVAAALIESAGERLAELKRPMLFSLRPAREETHANACSVCGTVRDEPNKIVRGERGRVCVTCVGSAAESFSASTGTGAQFKYTHEAISLHFIGVPKDRLAATSRQFPAHMRADLQRALERLFAVASRFVGVCEQYRYETLKFSALLREGNQAIPIGPAQYNDLDIGAEAPVKCLTNGLWLGVDGTVRYAVLLSQHRDYTGECGLCVEIATPVGEAGADFVARCFNELESAIAAANSYRGKVLSLESENDYRGRSKGIKVHRLPAVARNEVVLPEETLALLDRNVLRFVDMRENLRRLGQSTRKGILLYGPPGTGKTHSIRYLASNLPGHTTLIITAEQMGLLTQYMNLARLLQPALIVMEDVDLIARARENMDGPCAESLLNKLLNEMDGLKEDADLIFVLTTNRPETLEGALAGRPGRIDQSIEVPLPDDSGRDRLIRLYGAGLKLSDEVVREAVRRTKGVSAAFIKELMRRTAQAATSRKGEGQVVVADIAEALNDMLFTGGRLNLALLGGAGVEVGGKSV
jgi:hypothetical protein